MTSLHRTLACAVVIAVSFHATGCSPSDASDPLEQTPTPVAIEIQPPSGGLAGLTEGDTIRVTARVLDKQGKPITGGIVAWETGGSVLNSDARSALIKLPAGDIDIRASIEVGNGAATVRAILAVTAAPRIDRAFLWSAQEGLKEIPPPSGASSFLPVDINDAGEVLGTASFPGATATRRAYTWSAAGGYVPLGNFPGLLDEVLARSINDSGAVTGHTYHAVRGEVRPFVWSRSSGMMRPLAAEQDSSWPHAFSINNHGTIAGVFSLSWRPFRWDRETGLTILPIQSDCAFAGHINDSGDVLGFEGTDGSGFGGCSPRKFLIWDKTGRRIEISDCGPGVCRTEITAFNNARVVTGTRNGTAFRWSPATGFSSVGYEEADGYGINEAGDIVGALWHGETYPFLWTTGGSVIDIPLLPGTRSGRAMRINDKGQVVGIAR